MQQQNTETESSSPIPDRPFSNHNSTSQTGHTHSKTAKKRNVNTNKRKQKGQDENQRFENLINESRQFVFGTLVKERMEYDNVDNKAKKTIKKPKPLPGFHHTFSKFVKSPVCLVNYEDRELWETKSSMTKFRERLAAEYSEIPSHYSDRVEATKNNVTKKKKA